MMDVQLQFPMCCLSLVPTAGREIPEEWPDPSWEAVADGRCAKQKGPLLPAVRNDPTGKKRKKKTKKKKERNKARLARWKSSSNWQ